MALFKKLIRLCDVIYIVFDSVAIGLYAQTPDIVEKLFLLSNGFYCDIAAQRELWPPNSRGF